MQHKQSLPSGLTPLTFLSQPHLSSSPRVHARVTATATAAEDKACTKAASRVPGKTRCRFFHFERSITFLVTMMIGTLVHDSAKDVDPSWGGGTVPSAIPELVLTLRIEAMQFTLKVFRLIKPKVHSSYLFYNHLRCLAYRLHDLPPCSAHSHLSWGQPPQPSTWGSTRHGPGARQPP